MLCMIVPFRFTCRSHIDNPRDRRRIDTEYGKGWRGSVGILAYCPENLFPYRAYKSHKGLNPMGKPFLSLIVVIFIGWDLACVRARERRHSLIPSCQKILEKLPEQQQSSLRDIVQVTWVLGCAWTMPAWHGIDVSCLRMHLVDNLVGNGSESRGQRSDGDV